MNRFFTLIAEDVWETPAQRTHYRSKLYTSKTGVNPLVAAAHPLFSILERINLSEKVPDLNELQNNLFHELQAFMTKATASEHTEEIILVARYLLCATIDEVLEKAYHKNNKELSNSTNIIHMEKNEIQEPQDILDLNEESLPQHPTSSPDNHFFQIIEKAMVKPSFYLDIIELTYFCIITGFEGKYRQDPNGKQALENFQDKLYQIIQAHKPPLPEKLFVQTTSARRFVTLKPFPWKKFLIALSCILIGGYLIAAYQLSQEATHVLKTSSLIDKNATRNY